MQLISNDTPNHTTHPKKKKTRWRAYCSFDMCCAYICGQGECALNCIPSWQRKSSLKIYSCVDLRSVCETWSFFFCFVSFTSFSSYTINYSTYSEGMHCMITIVRQFSIPSRAPLVAYTQPSLHLAACQDNSILLIDNVVIIWGRPSICSSKTHEIMVERVWWGSTWLPPHNF